MNVKLTEFNAVDFLDSEEDIKEYLNAALEIGDPELVAAAVGDIARARGMAMVSREAGLRRESAYRAFSRGGNPELTTFFKMTNALGVQLCVREARTPGIVRVRAAKKRGGVKKASPKSRIAAAATKGAAKSRKVARGRSVTRVVR